MTIYEKIQEMTLEELADVIAGNWLDLTIVMTSTKEEIKEWLESEV